MSILDKLHQKKVLNPGSKVSHKRPKKERVPIVPKKTCQGCTEYMPYDKFRKLADGRTMATYCKECEEWYISKRMNLLPPGGSVMNIMKVYEDWETFTMGNNNEFKIC